MAPCLIPDNTTVRKTDALTPGFWMSTLKIRVNISATEYSKSYAWDSAKSRMHIGSFRATTSIVLPYYVSSIFVVHNGINYESKYITGVDSYGFIAHYSGIVKRLQP